ncbi:MAG: tRNA pseudouridine(38-40) synthase TruA [Chitinophagaceae bacterium]
MPRYFLEVSYKGSNYSGFQSQKNANSIQAEVEKAFGILHKEKVILTGSSRTDAGVHALQNFFHFDFENPLHPHLVYKLNAILPDDIVLKGVKLVNSDAHCRFDAITREYKYFIYTQKNPFLKDRAFYYPYKVDLDKLQQAAAVLRQYDDFTSFSKRNTQVRSFICQIQQSEWIYENGCLIYNIKANRFLRGMVRALTATMLRVGRGTIDLMEFRRIVDAKDCTQASFAVPPHGLFLIAVEYPTALAD